MKKFEISVLDLAPVKQNKTIQNTFNDSLDLARSVEKLNYKRFWLAEHHNMASIASSATSVLIGYIANGTEKIRVGSGGIMLPNHSSLVIAEQFGALESLFPGRIDLGVGRAPGTDGLTAKALGRNSENINQHFPKQIQELQRYFSVENANSLVRAIPGAGCDIPIYIDEELMKMQSVKYVKGQNRMSLPVNALTDEMLKTSLDNAIKEENYEMAQYLSEEIKRRKQNE